jgi:predicted ATP-grasp superfamily ATP-dependent carboligase
MGECMTSCPPSGDLPAFHSRYSANNIVLPSYAWDGAGFGAAVVEFVRAHPTRVIIPGGDPTVAALIRQRDQLSELGCVLALAPDGPLRIANDKALTLQIALELGIAQPVSIPVDTVEGLSQAVAELGFPFVLKPTVSWTGRSADRAVAVDVINREEAVKITEGFLAGGAGVLAQQWASGRREGVTLFVVDGDVLASFGHVEHRTTPPLGGASVVRESIDLLPDIVEPAVRLVKAIGLQGICEVEFRRDAAGRPLLMEINARPAGTMENAVIAGIDFPLMLWRWAAGLPVERVNEYRAGVRIRWLQGDLRWLRQNFGRAGRPDSMPWPRAVWAFAAEFVKTWHYDYFDRRDLLPFMSELASVAASGRRRFATDDSRISYPPHDPIP